MSTLKKSTLYSCKLIDEFKASRKGKLIKNKNLINNTKLCRKSKTRIDAL